MGPLWAWLTFSYLSQTGCGEGTTSSSRNPTDPNSEVVLGASTSGLYVAADVTSNVSHQQAQSLVVITVSNIPTCQIYTPHEPFWILSVTLAGQKVQEGTTAAPDLPPGEYPLSLTAPAAGSEFASQWGSGSFVQYGSPDGCGDAYCNKIGETSIVGGSLFLDSLSFTVPNAESGYLRNIKEMSAHFSSLTFGSEALQAAYSQLADAQISFAGDCKGYLLPAPVSSPVYIEPDGAPAVQASTSTAQ